MVIWLIIIGAAMLLLVLGQHIPALAPLAQPLRLAFGLLFVLAAVRIGFAVAVLAFGLTPVSLLIPFGSGLLAWRFRPAR